MNTFVIIIVAWLSNTDGHVVARAMGDAVSVEGCQKVAAERLATESATNPTLKDTHGVFLCWDSRDTSPPQFRKMPAPGAADL